MVQKYKCDNMYKVILLNASPRANSNTLAALKVCAEEIQKAYGEADPCSSRQSGMADGIGSCYRAWQCGFRDSDHQVRSHNGRYPGC